MFPKFSVKRPITVFVAVILVIVLGVISFSSMKTDLLPSFDLPYVAILTQYPGASPEKVETEVTKIIEKTVATTGGVESVNSVSSENLSMIILSLSYGSNMDSAIIDISGKLDTAKSMLGENVGTPTMMKINPDMMPVLVSSVDIEGKDIFELSDYVNNTLIPAMEKVEGVASVTAMGTVEKNIKVTLDQSKIDELNEKVLSGIDSALAKTQKELKDGEIALKKARTQFENESKTQTEKLINSETEIKTGLEQIEQGLEQLNKTKTEAQSKLNKLMDSKTELEKAIENMNQAGIKPPQEQIAALEQINAGIESAQTGIDEINSRETELNKKYSETTEYQKQIELGKIELTKQLSKAEMELSNKESEFETAKKEFETARDASYKNANLGGTITRDTISQILTASNFSMPAGYLAEGTDKYAVKVGDVFKSVDDVKALELFNIENVGKIKLEDISSVTQTDNSQDMYAKINGNNGVLFMVQKQSTASTSDVSQRVQKAIEDLEDENENLHINSLSDQGVYIGIIINTVLENLGLGAVLAVIILLLFLKNIRPTFVVAVSIPISLMLAVTLMYFTGVNLNLISLSGLALGVGMLVDNSIVVIENIYRLRALGMSAAAAAVRGAKQVSAAIFASTLTTICVFLPIVFVQGLSRELFTDMGLTIAYSLLASLIIALTLVPVLASTTLRKTKPAKTGLFDKFTNYYGRALAFSLKHRIISIGIAAVLLATSIFGAAGMGLSFIPESDTAQIMVTVEPPKEATTDEARKLSDEIMKRLSEIEDIETIGAMQGSSLMGMGGDSKNISMYISLKDNRSSTSAEISQIITEKTSDLNCTVEAQGSGMNMSMLSGSGLEVEIKGDDLDTLRKISYDIAEIVKQTDGTENVSDGMEEKDKETRITVDKNKALGYGLTVAQVYQAVAAGIKNDSQATTLNLDNENYPLIVAKDASDLLTRENLGEMKLEGNVNGASEEIKLSDIAEITEQDTLSAINHLNSVRFMTVTADIAEGHNIALISRELSEKLKDYDVPKGYSVSITGENETIQSSLTDLIKMVLLAIVLIYLIMVAIFQSLKSPFIVLLTIPLAFTGGLLALWIFGFEISVISMLGFLVLSGVVVNNGIVFVDCVNQLRIDGMDRREALIQAGKMRIRPIMMTALTTILALVTLALGMGTGADMLQPMAIVIVFGLLYATVLTLFCVPSLYDIFQKKAPKTVKDEELDINE